MRSRSACRDANFGSLGLNDRSSANQEHRESVGTVTDLRHKQFELDFLEPESYSPFDAGICREAAFSNIRDYVIPAFRSTGSRNEHSLHPRRGYFRVVQLTEFA
jgi:hypothetical protein